MLGPIGSTSRAGKRRNECRVTVLSQTLCSKVRWPMSTVRLFHHHATNRKGAQWYSATGPSYVPRVDQPHKRNKARSVWQDQESVYNRHTGGTGVQSTLYVNWDGYKHGFGFRGDLQRKNGGEGDQARRSLRGHHHQIRVPGVDPSSIAFGTRNGGPSG